MHVVAVVWQFLWLLFALFSIGPLVSAIRDDPRDLALSRRDWLTAGLAFFWAVDAVSGSSLPPLERVAKGVLAVLCASTLAVTFLRLRWRRRQTKRGQCPRAVVARCGPHRLN